VVVSTDILIWPSESGAFGLHVRPQKREILRYA
jgi:hypothetical protein